MSREELFQNIENWKIGIDEKFWFHCTLCGKCCIDREDILLNPSDMYRISKFLNTTPKEVFIKYCETYIGDGSRMPIVRLKPIGRTKRCPFLKNSKCIVHEAKPSVCAIYPLGRYIQIKGEADRLHSNTDKSVHYILQPITCGNTSEMHTVREWLERFDFEVEDKSYILWINFISRSGKLIREMEKKIGFDQMVPLWNAILVAAYLAYKTDEEFLTQFEKNTSSLEVLYSKPELLMSMPRTEDPPDKTE